MAAADVDEESRWRVLRRKDGARVVMPARSSAIIIRDEAFQQHAPSLLPSTAVLSG